MSLEVQIKDGGVLVEDVSDRVRESVISLQMNAEEGSTAISTIVIDDPEGDLIVPGLIGLHVYESETPDPAGWYVGYIAERHVNRADHDSSSFIAGAARRWVVSVMDQNWLLSLRLFAPTNVGANRPAETDVERVQWLLTQSEMNNFPDETYINTSGGVDMDAADYRGQTAFDCLNDCAQASGKNFFAFLLDSGDRALWYDFADSEEYSSEIRISNIIEDVDETQANIDAGTVTTFYASFDSDLVIDPQRVFAGMQLPYDGGVVFEINATTAANFIRRDTTAYSPNVKTSTKASARAIRLLEDISTEEERITTTIRVPNAQVNDLKEGMRVQCKFVHMPGYEAWRWLRVLNRTVAQISSQFYNITVELSGPGVAVPPPPDICFALNGFEYPFNASQTIVPLGLTLGGGPVANNWYTTNPTTDMLQYIKAGGYVGSRYPDPGHTPDWGNGGGGGSHADDCVGTQGGVDFNGGGSALAVQFTIIGQGTLTIETANGSGLSTCAGIDATAVTATARPSHAPSDLTDTDTQSPGTPLVIVIPDDGYCAHYVRVGSASGTWGFAGADWVAS